MEYVATRSLLDIIIIIIIIKTLDYSMLPSSQPSIVSVVWPIITWLSYSRSLTELKVLIRWFHRELLCVKWDVKIDFLITVADQLLLL